MIYCGLEDILG